jgi:hypothetical protein
MNWFKNFSFFSKPIEATPQPAQITINFKGTLLTELKETDIVVLETEQTFSNKFLDSFDMHWKRYTKAKCLILHGGIKLKTILTDPSKEN